MTALSAVTGALLASSWQVLVVAAAYALLRLVVRGARERYAGALVALALQLAWPVATALDLAARAGLQVNGGLAARSQWWLLVPLAWSLGAIAMLLRMLGGLVIVRRWVRTAAALEAGLRARFDALRERLGVRAVVFGVVGEGSRLDVPLTVGFWRPVVLVPASVLSALPVDTLELLVAHELVHVRRWDALVNAAQMVVEALLFFHPAMWWVSRCAREEREYCCDDAVVQHLGAAKPYAQALLALEQSRQSPATALAVASTGGAFVNRIRRLVGSRTSRSAWPLVVALVVLVGATAALAFSVRGTATAPVIPVGEELKPLMRTLCQRIHDEPCRPEVASLDAPPEDVATIVLADLGEQVPAFEQFLVALSKVPGPQRRDLFVRSVSAANGSDWQCPEFDTIWESQPVTWCGK